MTTTPIPFYVLCGSLGAGKTTLLMRLLEHWKSQGKRAGVLMNEAGEVEHRRPPRGHHRRTGHEPRRRLRLLRYKGRLVLGDRPTGTGL